jgi:hypothetical protein
MAKTTTVASIENGAFRARQKAAQMTIQEMNNRENKPARKPVITKVVVPPVVHTKRVIQEFPVAPAEPIQPQEVEIETPIVEPTVIPKTEPPARDPCRPLIIDKDEEDLRLQILASRAIASKAAGVDRAIAAIFRIKQKPGDPPGLMIKGRQSVLAIPVVKAPIAMHQIP